jgi:hypothetical protein
MDKKVHSGEAADATLTAEAASTLLAKPLAIIASGRITDGTIKCDRWSVSQQND